jgi:hypothetical protein
LRAAIRFVVEVIRSHAERIAGHKVEPMQQAAVLSGVSSTETES